MSCCLLQLVNNRVHASASSSCSKVAVGYSDSSCLPICGRQGLVMKLVLLSIQQIFAGLTIWSSTVMMHCYTDTWSLHAVAGKELVVTVWSHDCPPWGRRLGIVGGVNRRCCLYRLPAPSSGSQVLSCVAVPQCAAGLYLLARTHACSLQRWSCCRHSTACLCLASGVHLLSMWARAT